GWLAITSIVDGGSVSNCSRCSSISPPPAPLRRLAHDLDPAQNEFAVATLGPVFHVAEKSVRCALGVAPVDRALADALLLGDEVVAHESLAADDDARGSRLAAAVPSACAD